MATPEKNALIFRETNYFQFIYDESLAKDHLHYKMLD